MLDIDPDAPVHATATTEIDAAPEAVWAALTDVPSWALWQGAVARADRGDAGPLATGSTFRWTSGGSRIVSTVALADAPRALGWNGRAAGVRAVHVWRLEALGPDRTRVTTEESMGGWLARPLRRILQRKLESGLRQVLTELAAEARLRAAAGPGTERAG